MSIYLIGIIYFASYFLYIIEIFGNHQKKLLEAVEVFKLVITNHYRATKDSFAREYVLNTLYLQILLNFELSTFSKYLFCFI